MADGTSRDSSPAQVEIRECRRDDFETLYQIDRACYPPGIYYPRPVLREYIAAQGAHTLVVEANGQIAGFIIVQDLGRGLGHVVTIDVLADFRHAGIGSALLRAGEMWLASQGVTRVRLETAVDNIAAIALFQKFGYQVASLLSDYYRNESDAYLMEKILPPDIA